MSAAKQGKDDENIIISFFTIRKAVGLLGLTLPIVLTAGTYFIGDCHYLKDSVSGIYYTVSGTYLTGAMCAVGLFLLTYKGYDKLDRILSKLGGTFAIVTAIFPTNCDHMLNQCNVICKDDSAISNTVHYLAAGIFLGSLAIMSLFQFTKSSEPKPLPAPKRRRNTLYIICGCIMVVCLIGIPLMKIPSVGDALKPWKAEFWFESATLGAFGIAWLVKGGVGLED